jgi:type II secretory pathway pseudopilin PulG
MKMAARPRNKETGFALVDAMVALAIFAVMTGLLFQTISSTTMTKQHLAQSRRAMLIAQSQLAALQDHDGTITLEPSGKEGNFFWRAEVGRFAGSATDNSRGMESISVAVTDAATGRTLVTLKSLRLAH